MCFFLLLSFKTSFTVFVFLGSPAQARRLVRFSRAPWGNSPRSSNNTCLPCNSNKCSNNKCNNNNSHHRRQAQRRRPRRSRRRSPHSLACGNVPAERSNMQQVAVVVVGGETLRFTFHFVAHMEFMRTTRLNFL